MRHNNVFFCFLISMLFASSVGYGQVSTGVNTRTPSSTAVMEINSTDKGFLLPRISVPNVLNATPVTPAPADGLLVYNINENISTNIKKTLYSWDEQGNNNSGQWNKQLFFKETPKTAVIGLTGTNIGVLDDGGSGARSYLNGDAANQLTIISSGNLPNLEVNKNSYGVRLKLGAGTYIYEISFLLSAPIANPSNRAVTLGTTTYYNMGYYTDVVYDPTTVPSSRYGRVENAVVSQTNTMHRVDFSMVLELTQIDNYIYPTLGRRSGSTHRDLVNIIPNGTFIKITKLR